LEVLGPDGRSVVPKGRVDRVILSSLLLEPNGVVSRDRLIEASWGDHPPETALNALQAHISRLRRLLGTTPGRETTLRARPPGYVLDVSPGRTRRHEFERLATADDPVEDHETVAACLTDALRLWRGPVLDGLDVGMSSLPAVTRLEDLPLVTIERRVEADVAHGDDRFGRGSDVVRRRAISRRPFCSSSLPTRINGSTPTSRPLDPLIARG
jgi:DNA-binding SARP family transcriptional activator